MQVPVAHIFVKKHVKGEKFGTRGSISQEDWDSIEMILERHNVKTLLEFGAGFSTKKFCDAGLEVISLETNATWARIVAGECPDAKVIVWDNENFPKEEVGNGKFDLVFVDGVDPRERQVIFGREFSDRLLMHDTKRRQEQELIQKYLSSWDATKLSDGRLTLLERVS